jgi:hypothetical protein
MKSLPPQTSFVVYPYSKVEEPFLYIPVHEQYLVNIKGAQVGSMSSEEFTRSLFEEVTGSKSALSSNPFKYLVLYKTNAKSSNAFINSGIYIVEHEFKDSYLLKRIPN